MKIKLLALLGRSLVAVAWVPMFKHALKIQPTMHLEPVYEDDEVVGCLHYYSLPLKTGREFRYQWQPELDAFVATNGARLW